ncbi:MAG: hypothetical protein R6W92_09155 [Desulfocurvibacter africanus]
MIAKVSHVKNPLTVIAIFAGLAEVSGTVVLPFLEKDTQNIYVWFLMVFPCLLVLFFFITLYLKHYVLYAPSDFRDDKLFADLFVRGSGAVRVQKLEEEIEAETVSESIPQQVTPETISAKDILKRDVRATAMLAEELVLAKLSKDLGVEFVRHVTPRGQPNNMLDAVAMIPGKSFAVEVKYIRQGFLSTEYMTRTFDNVQAFISTLPAELRHNFQFVVAVALGNEALGREERYRAMINRVAAKYPFSTRIEIYNFTELEKEFNIK